MTYFCCCEIQIRLLLVAFNSWVYLAPASQKWCWRTRAAWKKCQAAILSPPSVLAIHLPVFSRLYSLSRLLRSFFLHLALSSYFLSLSFSFRISRLRHCSDTQRYCRFGFVLCGYFTDCTFRWCLCKYCYKGHNFKVLPWQPQPVSSTGKKVNCVIVFFLLF